MEKKVDDIRSATAGAGPPEFCRTDSRLNSFAVCSQQTVEKVIKSSPSKTCELDPAPTFLIKEYLNVLLPFFTRLCNASIQEGSLPSSQKAAVITPVLKKFGLDPGDIRNYRPISNLPFLSKVIEKLVSAQLSAYLTSNNLFPKFQSGFRKFHSTESAVLRVMSGIYSAVDGGQVALLALLDVSAAFDTVDHDILKERLSKSYGLSDMAYSWFSSFISGRTQTVQFGGTSSPSALVRFGIPQGSVLGPILYVLYTADVARLIHSLGHLGHLYADDTQLYGFLAAPYAADLARSVSNTIDAVSSWMSSNRLRLNPDKTQFVWFGTRQQLARRDMDQLAAISAALVEPGCAMDLGVLLDPELSMEDHVTRLCKSCFFQLRRLRAVRFSLTRNALLTLVHAFISSRLDYCNSLLYGTSKYLLDRLQAVLNAAARLILNIRKYSHISAVIRDILHWLPVSARIEYKICLLVRNCLAGAAPLYLTELLHPVSHLDGRRNLRSADRGDLLVPRFRLQRYGRRSFPVSGPTLWNSLPVDIRNSGPVMDSFKGKLKTFLMQQPR